MADADDRKVLMSTDDGYHLSGARIAEKIQEQYNINNGNINNQMF